jgi:glycosyltransferase involved in cell wall biosynthesis
MKQLRIGFIERRFDYFVSIEKVFRLVSEGFDPAAFQTWFQKLKYPNSLTGIIRNLLTFRPEMDADVYHVTGHCNYISLLLPPEKTVLTIHDLGFLHTRTGLRRWALRKLLLELPLKRLRYVTVVSRATKDEIERTFGKTSHEIRVIENPLDDLFRRDGTREFDHAKPRILQVGTSPNKNVENVVRALEGIDCKFTMIGEIDQDLTELLEEKRIDFEVRSQLDDEALVDEYRGSDIVVFCSTYEGFGLPIIEAQAIGVPVVTSDLSPLREVAGAGGAILVHPLDHRSIRKGIKSVIENPELRNKLIAHGLSNVARFDKKTIAAQYGSLYEEIAGRLGIDHDKASEAATETTHTEAYPAKAEVGNRTADAEQIRTEDRR